MFLYIVAFLTVQVGIQFYFTKEVSNEPLPQCNYDIDPLDNSLEGFDIKHPLTIDQAKMCDKNLNLSLIHI